MAHHAHPCHRAVCVNFFLKDGSLGTRAGGALWKAPWGPRNSADARDGTSVERCQQIWTMLRAVLLFDEL